MNVIRYSVLGCLAALLVTPLHAEPRTIDDCETIQAADAYNQCLASFGPVAKEHNLRPADAGKTPPAIDAKAAARSTALAAQDADEGKTATIHERRGRHGYRGRRAVHGAGLGAGHGAGPGAAHRGGGRKRASFTVRRRRHR